MTPQSDFMTFQWVYHSVKNPGSGHSLESTVLEEDAPLDPEVLGHGPWPPWPWPLTPEASALCKRPPLLLLLLHF